MKLKPQRFPNAQRQAEYRRLGYWGDATLLDYWDMAVRAQPDKTAVVDSTGDRCTYAELDGQASRLASWLAHSGVEPGDRVSVQLPGWMEFTLIYVACLKAGAVINPIIAAYRGHELTHIVGRCHSRVVFMPWNFRRFNYEGLGRILENSINTRVVHVEKAVYGLAKGADVTTLSSVLDNNAPMLPPDRRAEADDIAAVLFTSGTEKQPKGVLLTHNNIIASIRSFAAALNLNSRDTMFMPSPVGHATGFHHGVTTPFILGGTSVLQDVFKADDALNLMEREGCTYGMGAAPFVQDIGCALERTPRDLSALRFFLCGGASSPRHLLDKLWEKGFRVINVYGSTESVPHTTCSPDLECNCRFNTDGSPVDGCEVRVVDKEHNTVPAETEGEEASRGPNVFVGYLDEPELTAAVLDEEGWYYSGDLCVMTAGGQVRIIGRKKDVIVRGGENISSREVESILLGLPQISEAAVVGMPDPRLGERVCAFVTLKMQLTFDQVIEHFAGSCVAKCKFPERLEIVESIPKNPAGKVRKDLLRQEIARTLQSATPVE